VAVGAGEDETMSRMNRSKNAKPEPKNTSIAKSEHIVDKTTTQQQQLKPKFSRKPGRK
jgi:hypothetical protein